MGVFLKKQNLSFAAPPVFVIFITFSIFLQIYQMPASALEPMPSIPESSRLFDELDKEPYPQAMPPNAAALLHWDFSGDKVYSYAFSQKTIAQHDMGNLKHDTEHSLNTIHANGTLLLKSQGDKTANLVLKDMAISMRLDGRGKDEEPKTMSYQARPLFIQGVQEDGKMQLGTSSQEQILKILFPIPPKVLKVGESVDVPRVMPFNAMGSLLSVTGKCTILLTNYVSINGHTCARLETDIDISHLKMPPELKGTYKFSTKGKSVFVKLATDIEIFIALNRL